MGNTFGLNGFSSGSSTRVSDIHVAQNTPPTSLLHAEDDSVDDANHSLVYYMALKQAGVPVEMHLYAHGGHAFALRRTELSIGEWPQLVETWLVTIGMIPHRVKVSKTSLSIPDSFTGTYTDSVPT